MDILTSPLLERLPWIQHGFGTRHAPLSQERMASLKQVHSAVPLVADRPEGCVGEGDALMTREPGVTVSVRTADCFPVLLADMHHHAPHGPGRATKEDENCCMVARRRGANEADNRIGEVEAVSMLAPGWRENQYLCADVAWWRSLQHVTVRPKLLRTSFLPAAERQTKNETSRNRRT